MTVPTLAVRASVAVLSGPGRTTTPPARRGQPGAQARVRRPRGGRSPAAVVALLAALTLAVSACGAAADAGGGGSRELSVFASASLTGAFTQLGERFTATHPDVRVTLNFAASNDLVTQLRQGAPADVLATAGRQDMDAAGDRVDDPRPFAGNKLVIAVAPGNPEGITGLADLSREDLKVVLAAPEVPAGRYAEEAFARAGVAVEPASLEASVKGVATKIALGEADAGVVYVTDVIAAGGKLAGIALPDRHNVVATYPIATLAASAHPDDAQAFVDLVLSPEGQRILAGHGFLPAP